MTSVLLLMALATPSRQPVGATIDSIDALLLNASDVVVGRVIKAGRDKDNYGEITLAVEEKLKGSAGRTVTYKLGLAMHTTESWERRKPRVLMIMQPRHPNAYLHSEAIDLEAKLPQPFPTADLKVLRTPEQVMTFTRDYIRAHPKGKLDLFEKMPVPKDTPGVKEWGFVIGMIWTEDLIVPVDKKFEGMLRKMIASPYMQGSTGAESRMHSLPYRAWAASRLHHFRSQDNIALLKRLLTDEQYVTKGDARHYPVRDEAYKVLKAWGIDVPKPKTSA